VKRGKGLPVHLPAISVGRMMDLAICLIKVDTSMPGFP
jgi:hypothetical protein